MKDFSTFFKEKPEVQASIIDHLHNSEMLSIGDIADKLATYPNKIRRMAKKLEVDLRDKSQAQSNALATGKLKHPTKGRERTELEKKKIGDKIYDYWAGLSEEEMEERAEISRENWEKLTEIQKQDFHKKANQARLKTSKEGSKLESAIESILSAKFRTEKHRELLLHNDRLHIDILLPEIKTAIEIDGPTHFKSIYGDKNLERVKNTDNAKDGLLLNAGFSVVRIQQTRNLSKKLINEIKEELFQILEKIDVKTPTKFVIGDL